MIALSVHSFFEGLAVGLALKSRTFYNLSIAILLHKGAAALSLGTSLEKTFGENYNLIYKLLSIFVFSSPVGVALGIVISELDEIFEIIFASIAGGSFIYIACSEVIIDEFSNKDDRYIKLFAYIVGALIIFSLVFLPDD